MKERKGLINIDRGQLEGFLEYFRKFPADFESTFRKPFSEETATREYDNLMRPRKRKEVKKDERQDSML